MNFKPTLAVRCQCFDHAAENIPRRPIAGGFVAGGSEDVRNIIGALAHAMATSAALTLNAHPHDWCPTGRSLLIATAMGVFLSANGDRTDKRGTLKSPITEEQWPEIFERVRAAYDEALAVTGP